MSKWRSFGLGGAKEQFFKTLIRAERLPKESRIRRIIDMGQYTSSDQIVPSVQKISEKKNFHLSDGGNFIGQPWEELIQEIAKFILISFVLINFKTLRF